MEKPERKDLIQNNLKRQAPNLKDSSTHKIQQ